MTVRTTASADRSVTKEPRRSPSVRICWWAVRCAVAQCHETLRGAAGSRLNAVIRDGTWTAL
ncbi:MULTISPECIES: hypothetical protein [unclassified Streptomyces]|uniref:hypothetical protein n=1 Tax=unclassified Streptomyces TaxID=2593676 RepID=UPI002E1389C7|nr:MULTISPECIES: hypothetical protein [unclassified Streptomyces]WSR23291.1 hypothetical protein OG573_31935 [Streptomyces sp. NBC_01205]